jgi:hypothetical protein
VKQLTKPTSTSPMREQRTDPHKAESYHIAVVQWSDGDGIAQAIGDELLAMRHRPTYFKFDSSIPDDVDLVFSFAPYGRFLPMLQKLAGIPIDRRPLFIHWSMESFPNHKIPWGLMTAVGACRSWVDRLNASNNRFVRRFLSRPPLSWVNQRMHKFRYIGDYLYAYRKGWLDILFESSAIHTQLYNYHGVPAIYVPWGTAESWYADLSLDRDIDVLWMGKRRTRRRSRLIDQVRAQLSAHAVSMHVADNVENPFIFGEVRTRFLNRARITLSLLPTWYDTAYTFRFNLAAANRSLIVSEPVLPHSPAYKAGKHYVSAPVECLVDTILHYLAHEDERSEIVEHAYQLVTTELTFRKSIKAIMDAVCLRRYAGHTGSANAPSCNGNADLTNNTRSWGLN